MALPSYYTPSKPYQAPKYVDPRFTTTMYRALASNSYGPDGGTQPPQQPPANPQPSGQLTPIRGSIDDAEGINMSRGQEGQPYSGAGANASGAPRPPAASSSSGGGGGGGGGGGFDFSGDPILARIRAYNQMVLAQAQASALAQRKQAEIGYGYDPNVKYEDAATQEAARQNAFSTLANLLYTHGQRTHDLDESLNKSNLFYSGARADEIGKEGRQYTLEQVLANQGFQGSMNTIAKALLDTQLAAQEREIQAESDAYNRALQFALAYGGGAGGGGGGGPDYNDFSRGNNHTGQSDEDIYAKAAQYAPTYNGTKFVPGAIMQEGNAPPGYLWVKFVDPTGQQAGDTVLVPVG